MCLWLHIDQFICRCKGCLIMPVWLDAIPEKAPKVARPGTGRWLLFLAFVMLVGIALTLWCWTSERTGFVFWFTALGLPFCTWGLIFGLRRFAYKAEQVGAESRNVEREALIDSEILRGQRCAWILGTHIHAPVGNKADDLLKAMKVAAPVLKILHELLSPEQFAWLMKYSLRWFFLSEGEINCYQCSAGVLEHCIIGNNELGREVL